MTLPRLDAAGLTDAKVSRELRGLSNALLAFSSLAGVRHGESDDNRALRAKLMLEELSELLLALADHDEAAALDAIADLQYVVVGTAVSFDLPAAAAFDEVHRSNMTKGEGAARHRGNKGKGAGFSPADVAGVLARHRVLTHRREEEST